MEGIRFTRNRQNTRSFGKFLAGNPMRPLARRHSSSQVTSAMGIPFPDIRSVLFEIEFPCILLFLNRSGIRLARIAPKECTLSYIKYRLLYTYTRRGIGL